MHQLYLDSDNFVHTLDLAIDKLKNERKTGKIRNGKVSQSLLELEIPENLVVVGDLHGDIVSLNQILSDVDFERFLSNKNNKMVFLGDYVDRGSSSIHVLRQVCHLKSIYSDSVVLMRGNHEAPIEFPFLSHDFPMKIRQAFGKDCDFVYNKILELFQLLTLVTIVGSKISLVHGGPPVTQDSNYREIIPNASQIRGNRNALQEILWNDPRPLKNGVLYEPSRRSFGKHFGKEMSKKWMEETKTLVIVRSHEPCHLFRIDHDNMVMTIFSCKESYPKFEPGYVALTCKQLESIQNALDLVSYVRKIERSGE